MVNALQKFAQTVLIECNLQVPYFCKIFRFCKQLDYTVQHKKNSKTKRVDFGIFGGAEHEYEIYFFLSRQVFSAFYMLI